MKNKYRDIMERLDVRFHEDYPVPVSDEQLDAEEAQLGHQLPADYREFLRDYSGCSVNACFMVDEEGRETQEKIWIFSGSGIGESGLAASYYRTLKNCSSTDAVELWSGLQLVRPMEGVEEVAWLPELLIIGTDHGNHPICLALFGLRPGAVFYWRMIPHDNSDNFYVVANSFDEFMHLLRKDE